VIGANGKLTGFAGGLKTKAFLLKTESGKKHLQRRSMDAVA
jgi:methylated-DNA-[protein]-cysteine S-methyltransferase